MATSLSEGITKALDDETFSDVRLKCNGKTFHCHKIILAAASTVFRKMFLSGLKESENNAMVEIEDVSSAEIFEKFLKQLYHGDVQSDYKSTSDIRKVKKLTVPKPPIVEIKNHTLGEWVSMPRADSETDLDFETTKELVLLSDRYDVLDQVKHLNLSHLAEFLNDSNHVGEIALIAERINYPFLEELAVSAIVSNLDDVIQSDSWYEIKRSPELMEKIVLYQRDSMSKPIIGGSKSSIRIPPSYLLDLSAGEEGPFS